MFRLGGIYFHLNLPNQVKYDFFIVNDLAVMNFLD